MSTLQCVKPKPIQEEKQMQGQWSSVFPTTNIVTEQQSILFVKKLVAVGISSITYLRVIFPENAYQDHFAEGLNLKMLMHDSGCPGASTLISWVYGCFDAIEKKYLKQMTLALCIDPKDNNKSSETYTFKFSYSGSGAAQIDVVDADQNDNNGNKKSYEVKKPTLKMLRTIIMLTETLKPLPDDIMISMKLLYYDEVTPTDYEPPGFQPSEYDSYKFSEDAVTFKVGDVSTGYHQVKLKAKINKQMLLGEGCNGQEGKEVDNNTEAPHSGDDKVSHAEDWKYDSDKENLPPLVPTTPARSEILSYDETPVVTPKYADILSSNPGSVCSMRSVNISLEPSQLPSQSDYPVRCACNVNKDHGIMIICDVCGYWQHGPCFTIVDACHGPTKHYCNICADPPSMCTDPRLCTANPDQLVATCLYRRSLVIMRTFEERLTPAKLAQLLGVDISVGVSQFNRLKADKILIHGRSKSSGIVDKEMLLKSAFPKYLNKVVWQSPENLVKDTISVDSPPKETSILDSPSQETSILDLPPKENSMLDSDHSIDVEGSSSESLLKGLKESSVKSSAVAEALTVQMSSHSPQTTLPVLGKRAKTPLAARNRNKTLSRALHCVSETKSPFGSSNKKRKTSQRSI